MPDFNFVEGEILLLDKPYKWTSFDVVSKIRYALKPLRLKVGHAGTLDPLATGLLVICTGKLTKKIDELQAQEKEYTGTLVIGATTPSYDLETEIEGHMDISQVTEKDILQAATSFVGEIQQFPPAHSAVKIDGVRSYEKARRGEKVVTRSRTITVSAFDIERIAPPEIDFRIVCSKGTYIRSLAHDMGQKLGCGAYLSSLRRTRSGDFSVNNAWQLTDLVQELVKLKAKSASQKAEGPK